MRRAALCLALLLALFAPAAAVSSGSRAYGYASARGSTYGVYGSGMGTSQYLCERREGGGSRGRGSRSPSRSAERGGRCSGLGGHISRHGSLSVCFSGGEGQIRLETCALTPALPPTNPPVSAPPVLRAITPDFGVTEGGSRVTLTGANFKRTTTLRVSPPLERPPRRNRKPGRTGGFIGTFYLFLC